MSYLVMARKYRPLTFSEVVGQPQVVLTLQNALKNGRFAHAYIFSGPRGVGKTTTARILARALNCEKGPTPEPCGICNTCQRVTKGGSLDVLEIDAASNNGVDEIRNLRDNVRYAPAEGKFRVYIIDEIHMLSTQAFNAFLKTLEEPPSHAVFIGATTEIEKIPRTVLSRVQRFNFRLVPRKEIAGHLGYIAEKEGITVTEEALDMLAGRASGSLRDGLGLLDQMAAYCEDEIDGEEVKTALGMIDQDVFFRASDAVMGKQAKQIFELVDDLSGMGADPSEFMRGFSEHFRDLLFCKSAGSEAIEGADNYKQRLEALSRRLSELDMVRLMKIAHEASAELKRSQTPVMGMELRLLTMMKLADSPELKELLKRLAVPRQDYSVKLHDYSASAVESQTQPVEKQETAMEDKPHPENQPEPPSSVQKIESDQGTESEQETAPEPGAEPPASLLEEKGNEEDIVAEDVPDESSPADQMPTMRGFTRIKENWNNIAEALKKHNHNLGFFFQDAFPLEMKGNTLKIGCTNKLMFGRLNSNRNYIIKAIKEVAGLSPVIKCEAVENRQDKTGSDGHSGGRKELLLKLQEEDPSLKELVERFSAEPL